MTDRYKPLRDAIAAGPTKGAREVRDDHPSRACIRVGVEGVCDEIATLHWAPGDHESINRDGVWQGDPERRANAALIAAADPDTIAELLADRDALREALKPFAAIPLEHINTPETFGMDVLRARAALADGEES